MDLGNSETPKADGLKTALDIIVAPNEAFEQLRVAPSWGWAFLVTLVLYAVGAYLLTPALVHATTAGWPEMVAASPALAQETPEQQQRALDLTTSIVSYSWVFMICILPLVLLMQTVVLTIFKAIGHGDASFGKLWAVVTNIAVPSLGLGSICTAVVSILRGANSFNRMVDVQTAMPSLGMLVPNVGPKLHVFLGLINPFTLWACFLMASAMAVTARVSRPVAWTSAIVVLVAGAGLAALGAK